MKRIAKYMIQRIVSTARLIFAFALIAGLSACGGGGGNASAVSSSSSSSSSSTASPKLTVTLYNSAGVAVTQVTSGGGNYFKAELLDSTGTAVSGKVVTFAITGLNLASLTTTTALTNSQGIAQVSVAPAGASSGATTVTATATVGTQSATGTNDFEVIGTGSSGGTTGSPSLALQLFNSSNVSTSNVSVGGGNYIKATVLDASGVGVAGKVVTFSASGSSLTTFTPSTATALTNSSGVAQVSVSPLSVSSSGAGTFSAQSTANGVTVSGTLDYSVSPVNFNLGAIALGSSSLLSAANTSVTVRTTAVSGGSGVSGVAVGFSADCGTIQSVVTTDGSGYAVATYSSVKSDGSLCSGTVVVTAVANGAATQSANISIAAPVANALTFMGATPGQIFIKGSGAAEQSVVKFKVLAGTVPQQNVGVKFTLVENPGGVVIGTGSTTITSDSNGEVSIPVFSGTLPGPLKIKAELASNSAVFAETSNLTVFSGPPAQNFFDLAVDIFNIEGWDISGTPAVLSMIVGDRQGNPVPDGTVINFTAEGGQVAGSCATTKVNGIARCSVGFVSAQPRPSDGRVSVLAFTEGVKQFIDVNNNNAYDPGPGAGTDTLIDMGDAYRDDNEDGSYTYANDGFRIPKLGIGVCPTSGSPAPSVVNTCTGTATLATTVRKQLVIMLSSSFAIATRLSATVGDFSFRLNSADNTKLPMPHGTALSVDSYSGIPTGLTCTAVVGPTSVVNVNPGTDPTAQLGTRHTVVLTGDGCVAGVTYYIKVSTPKANVTPLSFTHPLLLSANSVVLDATTTTATVNALNGRSGYSVSSNATAVATATVSSGTVTITRGSTTGSATVTVTDGRGYSADVSVTNN